ncbi:hypothetical protein [Dyella subtropica]|uniref:hypothetical protein n=1 Tax=Dyella subtropica TaxID=2992127 RepID=UPI0022537B04|nr:hypothetical protein [Dyella subtropica]
MNEMRLPDPAPLPPEPTAPPSQGSLIAGIMLAWLTMFLGEVACFQGGMGAWLLPPVGILVWGIVLINGHKPRTGKGLLLGLASIFAVLLLLIAACFGLLSQSSFH